MSSEKFALRWNDFQENVSQSFGLLRQEEDLFDVTLVSEDEIQIPAHKLVLSASSSFFKSILRKNAHSHPLLYLGGVNSRKLNFILDYIYHGEVQLYQEELDGFIDAAQKLRIEGLRKEQGDVASREEDINVNAKNRFTDSYDDFKSDIIEEDEKFETRKRKPTSRTLVQTGESVGAVSMNELDQKIEEMTGKIGGVYTCRSCGKTAKDKTQLTRHIETHIEGLEYSCSHCNKTCRSRVALSIHLSRYHRN